MSCLACALALWLIFPLAGPRCFSCLCFRPRPSPCPQVGGRIVPSGHNILLGVRVCRGDHIDAAHCWSTWLLQLDSPGRAQGQSILLGVRVCRGDNIDAAHDWSTGVLRLDSPGRSQGQSILLGVRVRRGDNIDAAHDQGTWAPW